MVGGCLAHAASIENEAEEEIDGNAIGRIASSLTTQLALF
jgi:hypothetical protein